PRRSVPSSSTSPRDELGASVDQRGRDRQCPCDPRPGAAGWVRGDQQAFAPNPGTPEAAPRPPLDVRQPRFALVSARRNSQPPVLKGLPSEPRVPTLMSKSSPKRPVLLCRAAGLVILSRPAHGRGGLDRHERLRRRPRCAGRELDVEGGPEGSARV